MENNKFAERLSLAMEKRNIKANELSRRTGIDKSSISCYKSGKYKANSSNLYLIAEALHVNPAWLMGCDDVPIDTDNMTAHSWNASNEYLSDVLVKLSDNETILIESYRKADDKQKRIIAYVLGMQDRQ